VFVIAYSKLAGRSGDLPPPWSI